MFLWLRSPLPQAFPDNEVRKGQLTMQLKRLRETQEGLRWAPDSNELPVVSWDSCVFSFRFLPGTLCSFFSSPGTIGQETTRFDYWLHSRCFKVHGRAPRRQAPYRQDDWEGCDDSILWWCLRSLKRSSQPSFHDESWYPRWWPSSRPRR